VAERTFRYGRFPPPPFFSSFLNNKSDIGPRTLCNACGLVYAKLVCIFHGTSVILLIFIYLLLSKIKKRFKEKVINPNKKSVNSNNKGGGGGVNINNTSTTAAPRGGSGGGGGMYGMAGEESVDELSDDDEYGSQDPRKDMPD
jgi:hypothetical protein